MDQKIKDIIILLVIVGLVLFALGFGGGIFYQIQKTKDELTKAKDISSKIDALSSGLVVAIAAYGNVTKINGEEIIISYDGKSLSINVDEKTKIASLVGLALKETPKNGTIDDIKKGNILNVTLKAEKNGELTAQTIMILSVGSFIK